MRALYFCPVVSSIFFCLFFFAYSQPSQIGCLVLPHMVRWQCEFRVQPAGLKRAARGSLEMQDPKHRQKFAIWAPSHNFVGLYIFAAKAYRQSGKLVKEQYLPHMSSQYGELRHSG